MEASPDDEDPSPDLRMRIIQAVEGEGMSRRAAAERFRVAPSTVVRPPVRGTRRALRAERGLAPLRAACHQL